MVPLLGASPPLPFCRYVTPDPITLLGDYTPWADVNISATAFLPQALLISGEGGSSSSGGGGLPSGEDDPNARVETCEATPGPQSAQVWHFGAPAAGYISNTVTGTSTCLNLYGCMARLIYYECCVDCGCYNSTGFVFELQANGSLTAPLLPGLCAGVLADAATVSMVPCVQGTPSQLWTYSAAGQLINRGGAGCLTSQLTPEYPYVRMCARVTAYTGFAGLAPVPGYCLQLSSSGAWAVTAANATLGNGTLSGFDPAARQALSLSVQGATVAAAVGGAALGSWASSAFAAGMVALGSGVHPAAFDDLLVTAVPPPA